MHAPVSTYPGAEQQTHQGQTQAVGQKQRKVFYRDIDRNRALFKSGVNRESVRFCLTAGFVTARAGFLRRDLSEERIIFISNQPCGDCQSRPLELTPRILPDPTGIE